MRGIEGRVCVVTGAGQGNGKAIAEGLANVGAVLALCDINEMAVLNVAADLAKRGAVVHAAAVDVGDIATVTAFAADVRSRLGPVAVLVNNAGVIRRQSVFEDGFEAGWEQVFRVNVEGTRNMVRAFLSDLTQTRGSVVNLASIMAFSAGPGLGAYAASKGAVAQFTKALAHDLAPHGVRVNAIAPGVIATPMTEATRANPASIDRFMAHTPMGRVGLPEELSGPVLFLASDLASYVTGAVLPVDGGYLCA
ncbi:SDR family NAD(P)-dependent oxidoreductase [Pannonibacter sp.]|uniref:SDR family NAD(P)-dependent oxidoreductase n=1 Tax=Pannonibacter sp. TaxID=1906786 RepID=UPI003F6E6875